VPDRSAQAHRTSRIQVFCVALPKLVIEAVLDPDHPDELRLHTWDGRSAATTAATSHRGYTYAPAALCRGLATRVRFPVTSKAFGSTARLVASMREFLSRYIGLAPEAAFLLIAFALASHFVDCLPVAPVLFLLGPEIETSLVLRLLACVCRRPILLGDVDLAALATLPSQLDATLLINQRNLPQRVMRILRASNDRHFCIAHGNEPLNTYGAKAFSADPEFEDRIGLHISLSPARDPLPDLTDAAEKGITDQFQAKLLRFRMVNYRRVRDAQIECGDFVSEMRDEVHTWLAPICDCPDLQTSVARSLVGKSRELAGNRVSDDRCLIAEAALFFCHKENTEYFFVGELAECVNALLQGRHEDRTLTSKRVGLLLRAVGIHGERVVRGYKIELTDAVRLQIHRIARAYNVLSMQDDIARCAHCSDIFVTQRSD
jgi:hypothetical protein